MPMIFALPVEVVGDIAVVFAVYGSGISILMFWPMTSERIAEYLLGCGLKVVTVPCSSMVMIPVNHMVDDRAHPLFGL